MEVIKSISRTQITENDIKNKIKEAESIEIEPLLQPNTYCDFNYGKYWLPAKIINYYKKENSYEILFSIDNSVIPKSQIIKGINKFSFFREHNYSFDYLPKMKFKSEDINLDQIYQKIVHALRDDLKKYSPHGLIQFLCGDLPELFLYIIPKCNGRISFELLKILLELIQKLIKITLDNYSFVAIVNKHRSLILVDKNCAIIASCEFIIDFISIVLCSRPEYRKSLFTLIDNNLCETMYNEWKIDKKLLKINYFKNDLFPLFMCDYLIHIDLFNTLLKFINNNDILKSLPLSFLKQILMQLSAFSKYKQIFEKKEDSDKAYSAFYNKIKELSEQELKEIKNPLLIKDYAEICIRIIFLNDFDSDEIYNMWYNYIYRCLKSQSLEKKLFAINELKNQIEELDLSGNLFKSKESLMLSKFIVENNIIQLFLNENHDEILKKSIIVFKYLAYNTKNKNYKNKTFGYNTPFGLPDSTYDLLWDNYMNKHESLSTQIESIICEIAEQLHNEKRQFLYQKLKSLGNQMISSEPKKYFNFVFNLTKSCIKNGYKSTLPKYKKFEESEEELYGLPLFYKYIKDYYQDGNGNKVQNSLEIINLCSRYIEELLKNNVFIDVSVTNEILKLLLENINNKDSVIQSISLIIKECFELRNEIQAQIIKKTYSNDKSFDIIKLGVDNIVDYIKSKDDYSPFYSEKEKIIKRLEFIEYLLDKKIFKGKEHLEVLYDAFCQCEEKIKVYFLKFLEKSLNLFNSKAIKYYFEKILTNKKYFDPSKITKKELDIFKGVFQKININPYNDDRNKDDNLYPLYHDSRELRVKNHNIKGIATLYQILISNTNKEVTDSVCDLLSDLCVNLYKYESTFVEIYWKKFINDLAAHLSREKKNSTGVYGLIKLTNMIYWKVTYEGRIPSDCIKEKERSSELFKFYYSPRKKEDKIRVGDYETICDVRWRIGYFYDLPVNDIFFSSESISCIIEKGKLNDTENFSKCFNSKNIIKVSIKSKQLLLFKSNPKTLIDQNGTIKNILLELLHQINAEYIEEVWELLTKIPKENFPNEKIKSLGRAEKDNMINIKNIFDLKSIYSLTFTLDNIATYFECEFDNDEDKIKNYLTNFVNNYQGNKILKNIFFNMRKEYFTGKKKKDTIGIKCLISLLGILDKLVIAYPPEKTELSEYVGKITKFINLIMKNVSKMEKSLYSNQTETIKRCSEIIQKNFIHKKNNSYQSIYSSSEKIHNFESYKKSFEDYNIVIDKLLQLVDKILSNWGNSLIEILLENNSNDDFKEIFLTNYISILNPNIKKTLYIYLNHSLNEHPNLSTKFFSLVLKEEILNYINTNDKEGLYLHLISSLLQKYFPDEDHLNTTRGVQIILNFIKNSKYQQEKLIEGYLLLLFSHLYRSQKAVNYTQTHKKIYNLLLKECILSKCQENPLNCLNAKCQSKSSQQMVYKVMNLLCKKGIDLTKKTINNLNEYHNLGFWKTKKITDWQIDLSKNKKADFVGLKNVEFLCYMNSILQQFYMIPELRDAILNFEPQYKQEKEKCSFYQMKKIFYGLKLYESQYYNPMDLCLNLDGEVLDIKEQMDADEFYAKLIEKLENYTNDDPENKNMFKNIFAGLSVDELKFIDCGHKRENESIFYSIQLLVLGKQNIYESLLSYIKEEKMEGDNCIICEECKKKVPALKRLMIKKLPKKLIFLLKRFEYDYDNMRRYKINDYFNFPMEIDMFPYTQEYFSDNKNNKQILFDLTGIVIHRGTTESGHYYSIIKDSESSQKEDDDESNDNYRGKWYEFNDTLVKEFDIKKLADKAFGGIKKSNYDSSNDFPNAYILIYTKREKKKSKKKNRINYSKDIIEQINKDMYEYWVLKNISSEEYQYFVKELLKIAICTFGSDVKFRNDNFDKVIDPYSKLPRRKFESISSNISEIELAKDEQKLDESFIYEIFTFGCVYYFNIILRCKEKDKLPEFTDMIKMFINSDEKKAFWIIEEFINKEVLKEFLIECPISFIQKICVGIIYCAILKLYQKNEKDENELILFTLINTLLESINEYFNQSDLEQIYYLLYRMITLDENAIYKDYLRQEIKFDKFILKYFNTKKATHLEIPKTKKYITPTHSILSDVKNKKDIKLNATEEKIEKRKKERLLYSRPNKTLSNILIILLKAEEINNQLFNEEFPLLDNMTSRLNVILLCNKVFELYKDNKDRTEKFIKKICEYIQSVEYDKVNIPLKILSFFMFNFKDSLTKQKIELFGRNLLIIIKNNSKSFDYFEEMTNFLIKVYFYHKEEIMPYSKVYRDGLCEELIKFYQLNPIPPKYMQSMQNANSTQLSKKGQSYSKNYHSIEENGRKITDSYKQKLKEIKLKFEERIKKEEKKIDMDEDLTDFKFKQCDKVEYYGFECKVISVLDEVIYLKYEQEVKDKKYKYEWIETDNNNLVIVELND